MKDLEINKIIAEHMMSAENKHLVKDKRFMDGMPNYTKSLDALVPVWGELKGEPNFIYKMNKEWHCRLDSINPFKERILGKGDGKTIQQAAAHATAKAIMELK